MSVSGLATQKEMGIGGPAIRRLVGNVNNPKDVKVRDIWPFNDAPRGVRLRAVEKLPDVVLGVFFPFWDMRTSKRFDVPAFPVPLTPCPSILLPTPTL